MFIFRHSYSCADFNGKPEPQPPPSLDDYWGKHCALITCVDKPSRVEKLKSYPALPTPLHPTPSYPTPTLPHPYSLYPTLPLPHPYPSPTIPSPTLPTLPLSLPYLSLPFKRIFYLIWIRSTRTTGTVGVFLSLTSDSWVQCSRVGLEVKSYDTPAGGIGASQGTFSSLYFGHI